MVVCIRLLMIQISFIHKRKFKFFSYGKIPISLTARNKSNKTHSRPSQFNTFSICRKMFLSRRTPSWNRIPAEATQDQDTIESSRPRQMSITNMSLRVTFQWCSYSTLDDTWIRGQINIIVYSNMQLFFEIIFINRCDIK